jgi:hypothetical protein
MHNGREKWDKGEKKGQLSAEILAPAARYGAAVGLLFWTGVQ